MNNKLSTVNSQLSTFNSQLSTTQRVRCAIYTRKSCEDGLELEYNSLDSQYDDCKNYIMSQKHKNWSLVDKQYNDGGFSGGNLNRPALKELLKDIQLGLIDVVVVYKIDRLSRSVSDFTQLLNIFEETKATFVSITQNFSTEGAMGKFMLNIMLSFAQFEREMTGDRIRDKIRSQKKRGMWTGGTVSLGYDTIDKKLTVNNEEAKVVKLIFNSFLETKSVTETTRLLKEKNYKTKTHISNKGNVKEGRDFNKSAVYKVLKNKLYCGIIKSSTDKNIEYQGQHGAIIEESVYNEVQSIFIKNKNNKENSHLHSITDRTMPNNSNIPYLLKGLMKCKCCNSILTPTYTRKRSTNTKNINKNNKPLSNNKDIIYRYYKSSKALKGQNNCEVGNIPSEYIENIVLNEVYNILKNPIIVSSVIKQINQHKDIKDAISEHSIINSFKNIEVVWNELFPKEQKEIINTIIREIIINPTNVKIIFNNNGFISLLGEATNSKRLTNKLKDCQLSTINSQLSTINIAITLKKRGGRSFITTPQGSDFKIKETGTRKTNIKTGNSLSSLEMNRNALIVNLLQAEKWRQDLFKNPYLTIGEIAKKENKQNSYVCRILNLNYLAPDIKKAILTNQAPLGLSLMELRSSAKVLDWNEQRERWGFVNQG